MPTPHARTIVSPMATYLLRHRHGATECRVFFAAWTGFASTLRHGAAISTCFSGGHEVWWTVDAADETQALALLPPYVAARTDAVRVRLVEIP